MSLYERIEALRKERGISQGKLEKALGFSNGSVSKWKHSMPTPERLQKLAEYFGVSVDYLLGEETKKAPTPEGERNISDADIMFALWGDTTDMDKDDLEDVMRYAAFVRERKKQK